MIPAVRGGASLRSETGFIGVGAVIALAIVALGVYLLVAAFEGDPAYYGSVDVPSSQVPIELDGGEVNVSYAADVATDSLVVPEDLTYTVRSADGGVLEVSSRSGGTEESEAGAARLIGALDVPEDGTYFVTVEGTASSSAVQPALAVGLSPSGAVKLRLDEVVDELNGPTGIVVLIGLVLLLVIPRAYRSYKRRNRQRNDEILY